MPDCGCGDVSLRLMMMILIIVYDDDRGGDSGFSSSFQQDRRQGIYTIMRQTHGLKRSATIANKATWFQCPLHTAYLKYPAFFRNIDALKVNMLLV